MKKILCVADQIDPLIYDKSIKERYGDIDFIISAGDLPMEYLDFIQKSLQKPLFFVFGTHYLKALTHYHPEMSEKINKGEINIYKKNNKFKCQEGTYAGFKTFKHEGLLFAGLSGAKKENEGKNKFTEKQMQYRLFKLIPRLILNKIRYGRYLDILISHSPPLMQDGEENVCGFKCYLPFIKFFKPRYLIHGHLHIYDPNQSRIFKFEDTEVINVYSRHILEISE